MDFPSTETCTGLDRTYGHDPYMESAPNARAGASAHPDRTAREYRTDSILTRVAALGLSILFLESCGMGMLQPTTPGAAPITAETPAQRLELQGEFRAAARAYEELAAGSTGNRREEYLSKAVIALLRAQDIDAAVALFERTEKDFQGGAGNIRRRLLEAELALVQGRTDAASQILRQLPPHLPQSMLGRVHVLRAELLRLEGKTLDSTYERIQADSLIANPTLRQRNQIEIIRALTGVPDSTLDALLSPPPETVGGWVALAVILKTYSGAPDQRTERLAQWRQAYPQHPAGESVIATFTRGEEYRYRWPRQIALLLPTSGSLAPAGAALRDGLLAAYFAQNEAERPQLRLYPAGDSSPIRSLYERAVSDGADFVVGPLPKKSVATLAREETLTVPTLALNYLRDGDPAPVNLYQFGLSPEDEARQVADWARAQGARRAGALVPNDPWGKRVLEAFRERWLELGGELTVWRRYPARDSDFQDRILALVESSATRGDPDFLSLAATPSRARLIRSQLESHRAESVPFYATSHIFSGVVNPAQDRVMDGIVFCDIPWLHEQGASFPVSPREVLQLWPQNARRYLRLYAMGMDAYRIAGQLDFLRAHPERHIPGGTGELILEGGNRFYRRLVWARFDGGTPRLVGATPSVSARTDVIEALYGGRPSRLSGGHGAAAP
jgi:outer membrane PBP1 activator LpoA protein